jgi:hypothetical protein
METLSGVKESGRLKWVVREVGLSHGFTSKSLSLYKVCINTLYQWWIRVRLSEKRARWYALSILSGFTIITYVRARVPLSSYRVVKKLW